MIDKVLDFFKIFPKEYYNFVYDFKKFYVAFYLDEGHFHVSLNAIKKDGLHYRLLVKKVLKDYLKGDSKKIFQYLFDRLIEDCFDGAMVYDKSFTMPEDIFNKMLKDRVIVFVTENK